MILRLRQLGLILSWGCLRQSYMCWGDGKAGFQGIAYSPTRLSIQFLSQSCLQENRDLKALSRCCKRKGFEDESAKVDRFSLRYLDQYRFLLPWPQKQIRVDHCVKN